MITFTVVQQNTPEGDDDDSEFAEVCDASGSYHVVTLPPGVPLEPGVKYHVLPCGGGQMALYEGKIVAWRGCEPVYKHESTNWQKLD